MNLGHTLITIIFLFCKGCFISLLLHQHPDINYFDNTQSTYVSLFKAHYIVAFILP